MGQVTLIQVMSMFLLGKWIRLEEKSSVVRTIWAFRSLIWDKMTYHYMIADVYCIHVFVSWRGVHLSQGGMLDLVLLDSEDLTMSVLNGRLVQPKDGPSNKATHLFYLCIQSYWATKEPDVGCFYTLYRTTHLHIIKLQSITDHSIICLSRSTQKETWWRNPPYCNIYSCDIV